MTTTHQTRPMLTQTLDRSTRNPAVAWLLMPLLVLASLLALPSGASAAAYIVDSCQHPDGAGAGSDGWVPTDRGFYVYRADNCPGGGSLDAYWASDFEHSYGDLARWTFTAPSGATIRALNGVRSARAAAGRPYGTPVTVMRADANVLEQCGSVFGCSALDGGFSYATNGATSVMFGVECGGAPGGRCPGGTTSFSVRKLQITLEDNNPPTFNGGLNGSLTSPTSIARVRTVNYSANDVGGGIYRQRLLADGREVAAGSVDGNDGRCARYPVGNGFSSPVPCRTTASGSLSYDTAGLPDGAHDLELQVFDVTNENKVVSAWSVQVDNAAPSVGDVGISGTAREGEVLRCGAAVDGQSARLAYQWLRANADGSDVKDIPGATDAAYTIVAADVGKKLLCRLTATDGGGSTSKTSSLTAGPFAGGGLVAPKGSPAPSSPPDTPPPGGSSGGTTSTPGGSNGTGTSAPGGSSGGTTSAPGGSNGTGTSAPGGSSAANGAPAPMAPPPPLPACTTATVTIFGTATQLTRSYDHSGFTLSGRLTATSDRGTAGGAVLDLVQTVTRAGVSQRTTVGTVRTAPDGSFRVKVAPGPTRTVQVVAQNCGAVGPVLSERVRGALRAKANRRRVHNKQLARFHGRVLGGYLGRGLPLELQVRVGASWKDVKAVTSNSRGEYRVSYRFLRTYVRYTYRFRVVTRAGSAWPYMAARSRQVKVRVN
jgi:hypothetical protein